MKKSNKISALFIMCLMLISSFGFSACSNDDFDTDQYTGGIKLNVFGPCPVARGGELRFLGSGMNQITGIDIPGSGTISDITVVSNEEIRITVPQTAQIGLLTLHTPQGDIVTKTPISFTEPISFDESGYISPNPIKPGQELTIKGEYLNLIKEVIFADNVKVSEDEFTSHSRKEIKLIVPQEAQTGKIIISDGQEIPNWIYSADELQVVLPSVVEVMDLTGTKPDVVVKQFGKNLDLVKQVIMPNGDKVDFKVGTEGSYETLVFTLPANVSDGPICMIPASGVKVAIANIGVAVPTELEAVPGTNLRGGDEIVVKGVNMELVTTVKFPGVNDAVKPTSITSTEIKVNMPAAATSGNLVLNTESGKSVTVAISTAKPENISYDNSVVPAGGDLKISGKNLDVVSKILFGGNVVVTGITPTSASELTVKVPVTAENGALTLIMANGETVVAPAITVSKPECCFIPNPPAIANPGQVLSLPVVNGKLLTSVEFGGVSAQYIYSNDVLSVKVPTSAEGNTVLKLISSNGSISYTINVVPVEDTVWTGPLTITWGDGGRVAVPASAFNNVPAGSTIRFYFDQKDQTWAQAQINDGSWSALVFPEVGGNTLVPTDKYGWTFGSRAFDCTLTQAILTQIESKKATDGDFAGAGIIIQGSDLTFKKITIIRK